jgi:response regulator RpfG family c-di-GMP phosphodiesterase
MTPDTAGRVQTILIVDDEPDIRDMISDLLQATLGKIRCLTAPSGPEALEVLATQPVGIILCDFRMPQMDGVDFLAKAYRLAPQALRFLMTAYPELDVPVAAINEAHIDAFLTKPLDPDRVVASVRAAFETRTGKPPHDEARHRSVDGSQAKKG